MAEQKLKPIKENYMRITFGYSEIYIMPYKAGVELINAFSMAERLKDEYNSFPRIDGIVEKDSPKFSILSREEYEAFKMNALLGIDTREQTE